MKNKLPCNWRAPKGNLTFVTLESFSYALMFKVDCNVLWSFLVLTFRSSVFFLQLDVSTFLQFREVFCIISLNSPSNSFAFFIPSGIIETCLLEHLTVPHKPQTLFSVFLFSSSFFCPGFNVIYAINKPFCLKFLKLFLVIPVVYKTD